MWVFDFMPAVTDTSVHPSVAAASNFDHFCVVKQALVEEITESNRRLKRQVRRQEGRRAVSKKYSLFVRTWYFERERGEPF